MSLTKDQYNGLIAFLEKNGVDGIKHATSIVRGETNSCYSAGVVAKHSKHELKYKYGVDCHWILDTEEKYHLCNSIDWFISYTEVTPLIYMLVCQMELVFNHK